MWTWRQLRGTTLPRWAVSSAKSCPRVWYSMNELELVEWLGRNASSGRGLIVGIGHDCAVFRPKSGEDLLLTSDQLIEGVHFRANLAPGAIGERALARALSDIAA